MKEVIDAMILTRKGYMRGFVRREFDKEGAFSLLIDTNIHPSVKSGDKIEFTDVLVPYEKK